MSYNGKPITITISSREHGGSEKTIIILGTAHVSRASAEEASSLIREERPDTVCVELCQSRYKALVEKDKWQETDLLKLIKEKKALLLLSNLILSSFQKKIGERLGIRPGEEILKAIEAAHNTGARIILADRDIRTTLTRAWRLMSLKSKLKLLWGLLFSGGELDKVTQQDIEKLKSGDMLENIISQLGEEMPEIREVLIHERDQYLAHKISTAPGRKVVAIVGAGHVPGLQNWINKPVDIGRLEELGPKGKLAGVLKWVIPGLIIALMISGFFIAGPSVGGEMLKWWVLANALFSGLGAAAALAHPLTVLSAMAASPLTSLNPMVAAGWVAGLVEIFLRRPKVKDFESLPQDITTIKGFWKNKITRILLVVVLTNLGSSLGTFVAIPIMVRYLT